MSDSESIAQLQMQLAHLQRHVSEQDAECYRLAQRLEAVQRLVQRQQLQLQSLADGSRSAAGEMPADEKPPHY